MLDWNQPYPSARAPVCASNAVATSQPLAVQAGLDVMRRGGNAVDAAVATAITLTVVEPTSNGIGGDAFAIVWHEGRLVGLNACGRAPSGWTRERFAGHRHMPAVGWDSVTVPGAVSAWVALSQRFGRLDFADLFDAAVNYARDGFPVGPITAAHWQAAQARLETVWRGGEYVEFARHFTPAPRPGQVFKRPDLARTLEAIAASQGEDFYRGGLAERMARAAAEAGGALSRADLAEHRAEWTDPVAQSYRGVELHELPPNGQGLAAQIALGMLELLDPPAVDSTESVHLQLEIMKIAMRAAADHIADPDYMAVSVDELLDQASLRRAVRSIGRTASSLPPVALPTSSDTVYLCAADADGSMVSFIQSNYEGFGSGIVIPDTGIAMQNRGRGFVLDPRHPNCVGPGKKPFHTIIPGFVTQGGEARLAFGVMGGHMQHQGHFQIVQRIFDHGQNPQAASDAPRWHLLPNYAVRVERGFPQRVMAELAERGHDIESDSTRELFGGAQLILRNASAESYICASDHRKEGLAAGY